jgi:hypothetical protein
MHPLDIYGGGSGGETGHEGGVLSEKMRKRLRELGITEFFAGAFLSVSFPLDGRLMAMWDVPKLGPDSGALF